MFNVIDVAIESRLFLTRTYQHGINANDSVPFANHFDLLIADVALDIIVFARVGVRNNYWSGGVFQNVVEARRVYVRKIENQAEAFAFPDQLTAEAGQSFGRRSGRRKNTATAGGTSSSGK